MSPTSLSNILVSIHLNLVLLKTLNRDDPGTYKRQL